MKELLEELRDGFAEAFVLVIGVTLILALLYFIFVIIKPLWNAA